MMGAVVSRHLVNSVHGVAAMNTASHLLIMGGQPV